MKLIKEQTGKLLHIVKQKRETDKKGCQWQALIIRSLNFDGGGDCLSCMAWHGDPDAIEVVERLTGEKVNVRGSSYRSGKGEGGFERKTDAMPGAGPINGV